MRLKRLLQIAPIKVVLVCTGVASLLSFARSPVARVTDEIWTGTITYVYTQKVYRAGPYSASIYKKWNHFYEQRMEAICTKNKAVASSSIHLIDTSYYRETLGSRIVEQWENTGGTAQGKENTEVSIFINSKDKTYTIEVPIPETHGDKIKSFACKGCGQRPADPVTSSLGEDATEILVEDEKLGPNPEILSGEKIERKSVDNGDGEETIVVRWKFTRVKS